MFCSMCPGLCLIWILCLETAWEHCLSKLMYSSHFSFDNLCDLWNNIYHLFMLVDSTQTESTWTQFWHGSLWRHFDSLWTVLDFHTAWIKWNENDDVAMWCIACAQTQLWHFVCPNLPSCLRMFNCKTAVYKYFCT